MSDTEVHIESTARGYEGGYSVSNAGRFRMPRVSRRTREVLLDLLRFIVYVGGIAIIVVASKLPPPQVVTLPHQP